MCKRLGGEGKGYRQLHNTGRVQTLSGQARERLTYEIHITTQIFYAKVCLLLHLGELGSCGGKKLELESKNHQACLLIHTANAISEELKEYFTFICSDTSAHRSDMCSRSARI